METKVNNGFKKIEGKFNIPSSDAQIKNRQIWPVWHNIAFQFEATPDGFSVRLSDVIFFINKNLPENKDVKLITTADDRNFIDLERLPDALLRLGCPEWSIVITFELIQNLAAAISRTKLEAKNDYKVIWIREDENGYIEGFTIWDLAFTK